MIGAICETIARSDSNLVAAASPPRSAGSLPTLRPASLLPLPTFRALQARHGRGGTGV